MGKPKIRFDGYSEDWEQRKVTELLKNSSSAMKIGPFGSALKKDYFVEEGIKVYAQENAFTGDFSMGDYYITEDKYKELKSCELYPGDLVISMMGTIGACAIFPENAEKGIMNSHLLRLQFNNEVIPEYIMYLLRDSDLIRKQIDRLSVGSIMSGLSSSVVKKLVFPIPKLAEQKKIVKYLDSIDHLITLHQRKCDETKTLKKYMLQKMFPQNGEKVPEIRFDGFTEDWEQRKLEDLTKELSDYATMASGLPLLTSSRSGLMYQSDFRDRKTTTSNETLFSIVPKGSCTYRHMSDDDIFHLNINVLEKGLVSREYPVFISSENNDLEFIIQYINSSDRFRAFCKGQKKGGTRTRLYYKTLCEFEMMIPSIEEQKKISATLHNLDHLITLHQRKCNELKEIKKYMLQNMFV